MPARKKQPLINLLPSEEFASSTTGRIVTWGLSTFRYIVIATELVVIIAFLSRFWLDAQNTNLREEIEQRISIIAASAEFENEFREVQKRLSVYKILTNDETKFTKIFSDISKNIPEDVFLVSISITEGRLTIDGLSPNERSIEQFAVNLKKNAGHEKITLASVMTSHEDPSLLEFTLDVPLIEKEVQI